MQILLLIWVVSLATGRQTSYTVDDNLLDEVFDQMQYDDDDDSDDVQVDDVSYDYAYDDADQSTIPGKAGRDYPIYADIPNTSFKCKGREDGAYYADPQARCQVFHRCVSVFGVFFKYSFLCPNGSVFHQEVNTCDWWYRVECGRTAPKVIKEKDEQDFLIDVEDSDNTEVEKENTPKPIFIQTIIFDDDIFDEGSPSIEFGSANQNSNAESGEFEKTETSNQVYNVLEVNDLEDLDDVIDGLQSDLDKKPKIRYYGYPIGQDYYEVIYDVFEI